VVPAALVVPAARVAGDPAVIGAVRADRAAVHG